ncbi:MAG: LytTR family DNA-binding domain-containing protein [Lachnospiraceae bacterium]
MKIQIEINSQLSEDEFIIRCRKVDGKVQKIQEVVADIVKGQEKFVFYKGEKEYYLPLEQILFFETTDSKISAHTVDNVYLVKYRLYELEEILPKNFIRISKSTIMNLDHVYAINRNLTSASIVEFNNTYKQVCVSRYYFRTLQEKMKEWRR